MGACAEPEYPTQHYPVMEEWGPDCPTSATKESAEGDADSVVFVGSPLPSIPYHLWVNNQLGLEPSPSMATPLPTELVSCMQPRPAKNELLYEIMLSKRVDVCCVC